MTNSHRRSPIPIGANTTAFSIPAGSSTTSSGAPPSDYVGTWRHLTQDRAVVEASDNVDATIERCFVQDPDAGYKEIVGEFFSAL
jgi:hypothetical protein